MRLIPTGPARRFRVVASGAFRRGVRIDARVFRLRMAEACDRAQPVAAAGTRQLQLTGAPRAPPGFERQTTVYQQNQCAVGEAMRAQPTRCSFSSFLRILWRLRPER